MGILNKIVNVVVVVLAVACVVLGTMLFQKREDLRSRGDKMARTIKNISVLMDKESGTDFSEKVDISETKPELDERREPKLAAENKAKSLHLANYPNLENILMPIEKQTSELMRQRDRLADALNTISESLKMQETYGTTVFRSLKTYDEKKKSLLDNVAKVNTRDEAIIDQIVSSSRTLGFTVDPTALKDLNNFRPALNEFGGKIDAFKKRLDSYSSSISRLCSIMEISQPSLISEDYANELSSVEGKFRDKKAEHDNTKRNLATTQDELKQTQETLSKEQEAKKELEGIIVEKDGIIENMRHIIAGGGFPTDRRITNDDLLRMVTGRIVEVNDKWNFVIVRFDHEGQVKVSKPPFGREFVPVEIPLGRTLVVSRQDKPIAELRITRVLESCSVADIVPDKKWADIQPGDVVTFPETN